MTINKFQEGTALTLALEGRLDTNTAPELEQVLNDSLDDITALEIDFANLEYISSAGLRVLLIMKKGTENGVKLRNINSLVKEILEQTGFDSILEIACE